MYKVRSIDYFIPFRSTFLRIRYSPFPQVILQHQQKGSVAFFCFLSFQQVFFKEILYSIEKSQTRLDFFADFTISAKQGDMLSVWPCCDTRFPSTLG